MTRLTATMIFILGLSVASCCKSLLISKWMLWNSICTFNPWHTSTVTNNRRVSNSRIITDVIQLQSDGLIFTVNLFISQWTDPEVILRTCEHVSPLQWFHRIQSIQKFKEFKESDSQQARKTLSNLPPSSEPTKYSLSPKPETEPSQRWPKTEVSTGELTYLAEILWTCSSLIQPLYSRFSLILSHSNYITSPHIPKHHNLTRIFCIQIWNSSEFAHSLTHISACEAFVKEVKMMRRMVKSNNNEI